MAAKIYVLEGHIDYEGGWTQALFSTPELARAYVSKLPRKDYSWSIDKNGKREYSFEGADSFELYEMEIDVADPGYPAEDRWDSKYKKSLEVF